jgi:hypothetical protein
MEEHMLDADMSSELHSAHQILRKYVKSLRKKRSMGAQLLQDQGARRRS